jgi:hypothetical protein
VPPYFRFPLVAVSGKAFKVGLDLLEEGDKLVAFGVAQAFHDHLGQSLISRESHKERQAQKEKT